MKAVDFQTQCLRELGEAKVELTAIRSAVEASEKARAEWQDTHEAHDNERFRNHSDEQKKTSEAISELKKDQDAQTRARVVELTGQLAAGSALKQDWQIRIAMLLIGGLLTWILHEKLGIHF